MERFQTTEESHYSTRLTEIIREFHLGQYIQMENWTNKQRVTVIIDAFTLNLHFCRSQTVMKRGITYDFHFFPDASVMCYKISKTMFMIKILDENIF
jgi:hypothetical protein